MNDTCVLQMPATQSGRPALRRASPSPRGRSALRSGGLVLSDSTALLGTPRSVCHSLLTLYQQCICVTTLRGPRPQHAQHHQISSAGFAEGVHTGTASLIWWTELIKRLRKTLQLVDIGICQQCIGSMQAYTSLV